MILQMFMAIIYFVAEEVDLCCRHCSVVFYDVIDDCVIVQLQLLNCPCLVRQFLV